MGKLRRQREPKTGFEAACGYDAWSRLAVIMQVVGIIAGFYCQYHPVNPLMPEETQNLWPILGLFVLFLGLTLGMITASGPVMLPSALIRWGRETFGAVK